MKVEGVEILDKKPVIIAVLGYKGRGKSRIIEILVEHFVNRKFKVGVIKHSHHQLQVEDKVGSDTWRFKNAGAHMVCGIWNGGVFFQAEMLDSEKSNLKQVLEDILYLARNLDLVFIEGFKKLVCSDPSIGKILTFSSPSELEELLGGVCEPVIAACTFSRSPTLKTRLKPPIYYLEEDKDELIGEIYKFIGLA